MKRKISGTSRGARSSRIALMAGMLAAPVLAPPVPAMAQAQAQTSKPQPVPQARADSIESLRTSILCCKFSVSELKAFGTFNVVGGKGSQPVFRNDKNALFTFGPNGDMQFLGKADSYMKWTDVASFSFGVVGMDLQGRMILKNDKNQQFFFDPMGKMNFVKVK